MRKIHGIVSAALLMTGVALAAGSAGAEPAQILTCSDSITTNCVPPLSKEEVITCGDWLIRGQKAGESLPAVCNKPMQ